MTLNDIEQKILSVCQHGMPMSRMPYQDLAQMAGICTEELLEALGQWQTDGKIRRVGAVINHFQAGYGCGAMVAWNVPDGQTDGTGELFASFPNVSHVYQRQSQKDWPYNLYTMVHAPGNDELERTIETMSRQSGIKDFRVLKTVRELKKVPPTYIEQ